MTKTNLPRQYEKDRKIFLIADQHYNHANIIKYSERPFKDVQEMNAALDSNHQNTVRPTDCTIHIGDFLFGTAEQLIRKMAYLHGTHYLMNGSHDRALEELEEQGIPEELNEKIIILPQVFEFQYAGKKITLHHYAQLRWRASHHGAVHFFGHSHGHLNHPGRAIDVGVDCQKFYPVQLDEMIKLAEAKQAFPNHPCR